jgi:hypothetical protein
MELYQKNLAEALDKLVEQGRVVVSETRTGIAVNQLNGAEADHVLALLEAAGWTDAIAADEGGKIPSTMVAATDDGVRVTAARPELPNGIDAVLTSSGFANLLERDPESSIIWVEGLNVVIDTRTVRYAPWGTCGAFVPMEEPANPARVVRVLGQGGPGTHIGRWILRMPDTNVTTAEMAPWRRRAASHLLASLAQEIEPGGGLLFRGPPPTRFAPVNSGNVDRAGFAALQAALSWVFESEREFENRHGLVAAEVARTSLRDGTLCDLASTLGPALEGARIAYGFGITQQSKDTLKALTDLRKAVTDDATKLSETTRSLAAAVVGAVFGNIGLIMARLVVPANGVFIGPAAIMLGIALAIYVGAIVASGAHYISIQRELRRDWRNRLYRYLEDDEYNRMVNRPAERAEYGFWITAAIGIGMTLLVLGAVCFIAVHPPATNPNGPRGGSALVVETTNTHAIKQATLKPAPAPEKSQATVTPSQK